LATGTRKPNARKAPARRSKAATRRTTADTGPPSLSFAHLQGFIAGLVVGALLGAAGVIWLSKESGAGAVVQEEAIIGEEGPQPRFDFYTVLPSQTLDLTSDVTPPDLSGDTTSDLYVLQAGSFKLQEDADRRRGELALLGLEATIERTTGDNGVWYRVYLGPFDSRSKMAQARSITAQQSIDTLLLRRPRTP